MTQKQLAESYFKQLQDANQPGFELQTAVAEHDEKLTEIKNDQENAAALREQLTTAKQTAESQRETIGNLKQQCANKDMEIEDLNASLELAQNRAVQLEKDLTSSLKREPESGEDIEPPSKKPKKTTKKPKKVKKGREMLIARKTANPQDSPNANLELSEDLGKNKLKFKASVDCFDEDGENLHLVDGHTLPLALQSIVQKTAEAWDEIFGDAFDDHLIEKAEVDEGSGCVSSELALPLWEQWAAGRNGGGYACSECAEAGIPCFAMERESPHGLVLLPLNPDEHAQAEDMEDFAIRRWIRIDKMPSDEERIAFLDVEEDRDEKIIQWLRHGIVF